MSCIVKTLTCLQCKKPYSSCVLEGQSHGPQLCGPCYDSQLIEREGVINYG